MLHLVHCGLIHLMDVIFAGTFIRTKTTINLIEALLSSLSIFQFEPYLMENPDKNAEGNDRYIGFIADLVKELARRLDFKYKLKLVDDGKWGSRDTSTGQWNGMIGEVISSVS